MIVILRQGLYDLDPDLYEDTLKLFDVRTNIGFIGGKNSRHFTS